MRKIIQIASSVSENTNTAILSALCDDGTVWQKVGLEGWKKIKKIPQKKVGRDSDLPQDEPQE